MVCHLRPHTGLQSGGTRLCISGSKLNVDSNLTVYLDNLTCTVDKTLASNSQISCKNEQHHYTKVQCFLLNPKDRQCHPECTKPFQSSRKTQPYSRYHRLKALSDFHPSMPKHTASFPAVTGRKAWAKTTALQVKATLVSAQVEKTTKMLVVIRTSRRFRTGFSMEDVSGVP
nr:uncharacterized protein LOC119165713 isoform X2 [Rhipicephalus microplus]